jgi:predicted XRE-type DNA-binding protein
MSRNAFADLGFAEDKAAEMALRTAVAVQIVQVIKARNLTQNDAKRLFGVPQPTISKVMKLRLANLSLAFLLRMLFKAALPFEIKYGGNSQAIDAMVAREPRSAAVSVKDWNFDVSASLDSNEVEVFAEPSGSSFDSTDSWPAKTSGLVN